MIVRSIVAFGSDFEQSGVSISWVIPFKTRLNWDIPGYPRLSFSPVQGYPVISHLVQSYPPKRYPRISRDIPRQDSCIGISHYKFSVLGYPKLSRDKYQVGFSRDIPGYPLWSFFQMLRTNYAQITQIIMMQKLRRNYADITQKFSKTYTEITYLTHT